MGAARSGWGAAEQDPQVTEKEGVEQEVALVAGSQSSPLAAVNLPQVEASATRNPREPIRAGRHVGKFKLRQAQEWRGQIPAEQGPLREGSHSDHLAAEEWSRNLTGEGGPGAPVRRPEGESPQAVNWTT